MYKSIRYLSLLTIVLLFTLNPALAGSGKDSVSTNFTAEANVLPGGKAHVAMIFEIYGFAETKNQDSPFYKASYQCRGYLHVENKKYITDTGFCVYTRSDGDQVFLIYETENGEVGKGGKGKVTLAGGTGKWEGLAGGGSLVRTPHPRPSKSHFVGYQNFEISWKTP